MRFFTFFLCLLIIIPAVSSYANLTAIPETPPALTLDVNETFPPSSFEGGVGGGGGVLGEGNVTGTVEDSLNNESIVPVGLQEELDKAQEEKDQAEKERESRRNPDKEGSAAVTVDENILGSTNMIPLIAIVIVLGILVIIVINGKKKKKRELPQKA